MILQGRHGPYQTGHHVQHMGRGARNLFSAYNASPAVTRLYKTFDLNAVPDPKPQPIPPKVPKMTVLEIFEAALANSQELPVINGVQFNELVANVTAAIDVTLTQFDLDELSAGRYKGQGFGVDYSGAI